MIRFHRYLAPLMVHRDEVRPDPANDNNGDVDELLASLQVNGCYRPVYASMETKHIIAGHTLYSALLEAGETRIPVAWLDGDDEQARRMLVADNQIARLARPDSALTVQLLNDLNETELGLLGTGFTDDDYLRLAMSSSPDNFGGWGGSNPDPIQLRQITCPECGHTWSD